MRNCESFSIRIVETAAAAQNVHAGSGEDDDECEHSEEMDELVDEVGYHFAFAN
jgi:hypothetical protein